MNDVVEGRVKAIGIWASSNRKQPYYICDQCETPISL